MVRDVAPVVAGRCCLTVPPGTPAASTPAPSSHPGATRHRARCLRCPGVMLSDFADLLASLDDDVVADLAADLPDLDRALAVVDLDAVLAEHDRRVAARLARRWVCVGGPQ